MKNVLIVLFVAFSLTAYAADKDVFAVKGEKIYSPTLAGSFVIYIMAPDRLAGWNGQLMQHETDYLPKKYQNLPVLGGWQKLDKEALKKQKVTKAFVIGDPDNPSARVEELKSLGMDVLILKASNIDEYVTLLQELGRQMGIPKRGNELAALGKELLDKTRNMVKDIPDEEKVSAFFGSGSSGLSGICYLDALEIAGGKNAYDCPAGELGEAPVSFEQLLELDPNLIFLTNPSAQNAPNDPQWHNLTAYKEKRLYVVPFGPLGWLHHATPANRFIGAPWLACKLYPEKCNIDIEKEAKRYYKLFFNMGLNDKQLKQIMYRN